MTGKKRKQITFDIDTKVAEKILGAGYRKIYDDIKRFAKTNGFAHIEGSVYMSESPMSNLDVKYFLSDLKEKYPYLEKCIRDIRKTDISNTHSLNYLFSYDGTPGKYKNFNQKENKINSSDNPNRGNFSSEQIRKPTDADTSRLLKTSVTLEQLKEIAEQNIPFRVDEVNNNKIVIAFYKSNLEKIKSITAPSEKKKTKKPKR